MTCHGRASSGLPLLNGHLTSRIPPSGSHPRIPSGEAPSHPELASVCTAKPRVPTSRPVMLVYCSMAMLS
uniref:Uncharacterized protein n=1 Tax=Arundo donax TaxID=35708 RepID=A0A0A9EA17_ARUDO